MNTAGRRSFYLIVFLFLSTSLVLGACNPSSTPIATEMASSSTELLAEVNFEVTLPSGSSSKTGIDLEILDEVTGLALNPSRYPMTALSDNRFSVSLAFPPGSVLKYRYIRAGTPPAVEYDSLNQQIRYRNYWVTGPSTVQDIVAAWNDQSFAGETGRITGQATDATSGLPIPSLMVSAAGVSTLTASDGSFLLEGIPVGTHVLTAASLDGEYAPFQQGATVAAGATTPAVFSLAPAQMVTITFVVKPPKDNLTGIPIRMIGNLYSLGNTFADLSGGVGVIASRAPLLGLRDDGSYSISLKLPAGFDLRYKYTLGDGFWNGELTTSGNYHTRQLIVPQADTTIEDEIDAWSAYSSAPVTFTVTVPADTPATDSVSIQFNPFGWMEPIPMWPLGDHKYTYILYNPISMFGNLGYRYCRNEQCGVADSEDTAGPTSSGHTLTISKQAQTIEDTVAAWHWWQTLSEPTTVLAPDITNRGADFLAGAELQQGYAPNWQSHYAASFQTLSGIGANTVVIPMTWTFTRDTAPVLKAIPGKDALWSDLKQQVKLAQESGLDVIIAPYVQFEIAGQDWWEIAARDTTWWNSFFAQYRVFLRSAADFATDNGVTALILGDPALSPAYPNGTLTDGSMAQQPEDIDARWEQVIADTRSQFSGQLIWQLEFTGNAPESSLSLNLFDAIYLDWEAPLTASDTPSESDLEAEFGRLLDEEIAPLREENDGLPVILALSFASATGAGRQCVTLNVNCLPDIALAQPYLELQSIPADYQAQVDLYNAALGAMNARDWISGVIARGFYPPVALQDGSISPNGKPAMDILWYWFQRLTGETGQ